MILALKFQLKMIFKAIPPARSMPLIIGTPIKSHALKLDYIILS